MIGTPEATAAIVLGSIVQLNPQSDATHDDGAGPFQLGVVAVKHSWGCDVDVNGGVRAIAWQHLEPTGGTIVWQRDGSQFRPSQPAAKHHP